MIESSGISAPSQSQKAEQATAPAPEQDDKQSPASFSSSYSTGTGTGTGTAEQASLPQTQSKWPHHVQDLTQKFQTAAAATTTKEEEEEAPPLTPPRSTSTATATEDTPLDILVPLNDAGNDNNTAVLTPIRSPTTSNINNTASKTQFYTPYETSSSNSPQNNNNNDDNWINHYFVSSNHSVDLSVDSLDQVDREYLGNARRHEHNDGIGGLSPPPALNRLGSDSTLPQANTTTTTITTSNDASCLPPLCELQVADSHFLGYATCGLMSRTQVMDFVAQIQQHHPKATHIPYAWYIPSHNNSFTTTTSSSKEQGNVDGHGSFSEDVVVTTSTNSSTTDADADLQTSTDALVGFEEDGEPESSTGPILLKMIRESGQENNDGIWLFPEEAGGVCPPQQDGNNAGTAVVIVRYFGSQLLGVTCGRLTHCYQRVAQCALHRLFRGTHIPQYLELSKRNQHQAGCQNLYGLAAGDTELHVNAVVGQNGTPPREEIMATLLEEMDFGGFKGAAGEVLPRLQNLQADFYKYGAGTLQRDNANGTIVPVYRYPGNYLGDEWETFRWSPLSYQIKETVEATLPHFYHHQTMNHCVTNYYRHADDYIAHHSDKDLDLDHKCAIVSVSIGAERILELRRREEPRDITRLRLPHGSMLLLGPMTNQQFTHSILPAVNDDTDEAVENTNEERPGSKYDKDARISLTLRHVSTFMDTATQRLFGQGVDCGSLQDLRRSQRLENIYFCLGFGSLWNAFQKYSTPAHSWTRFLFPWSSSSSLTKESPSSSRSHSRGPSGWWQSLAQEGLVLLGSAGVAWWSYTRARKAYHRRQEERAARDFFTRTSTSGTIY